MADFASFAKAGGRASAALRFSSTCPGRLRHAVPGLPHVVLSLAPAAHHYRAKPASHRWRIMCMNLSFGERRTKAGFG